jgi:hypothetical protein
MSKKSTLPFGADLVLQLALAAFFLAAGILGVTQYNSDAAGLARAVGKIFGKNDTLNLIVAIVQIAMGGWLVIALFVRASDVIGRILGYLLAALWAVWMVMTYFATKPFEPSFIIWLSQFSRDLVILIALWIVGRRIAAK